MLQEMLLQLVTNLFLIGALEINYFKVTKATPLVSQTHKNFLNNILHLSIKFLYFI